MKKSNVLPFLTDKKHEPNALKSVGRYGERRLMTASDAAAYLGYKSPAILKKIGLTPIRLELVGGVRGEPKYDRLDLDALIERSKGEECRADSRCSADLDDADAALLTWRLKRGT